MTDSREPATVPDRPFTPTDVDSVTEPAASEPEPSNRPLPIADDEPGVGLSQKGSGEDAIVRRETDV